VTSLPRTRVVPTLDILPRGCLPDDVNGFRHHLRKLYSRSDRAVNSMAKMTVPTHAPLDQECLWMDIVRFFRSAASRTHWSRGDVCPRIDESEDAQRREVSAKSLRMDKARTFLIPRTSGTRGDDAQQTACVPHREPMAVVRAGFATFSERLR